MNALTR